MNKKAPFWLMGIAGLLLAALIVNQILWVFTAAEQQENQFNKQVQMALGSIESKIQEDPELCSSVGCCLIDDQQTSCSSAMQNETVWDRTDKMIGDELKRFDINLNYNFDICYRNQEKFKHQSASYQQEMGKVFDQSGIVLYLEFPDKSKYLRNQIGPVFISSILLIIILSIVFVLTYRYYKRERNFSQRTRDFINNMTHEFNTPLTNISLANSMLNKELEVRKEEKLMHYSAIINEENQRLAKNCDELLQMAKIENALEDFTDVVDVHALIQDVVNRKLKQVSEKRIDIQINFLATKHLVLGRENLFSNTISNLIDNAVKYSRDDVSIQVITENKGDMIRLQVIDNGVGMNEEELPNIFDKFYRISQGDQHNIKGFGLGLAYVNMVIQKMRGSIKVESKLGKGTTFNILIPLTSKTA